MYNAKYDPEGNHVAQFKAAVKAAGAQDICIHPMLAAVLVVELEQMDLLNKTYFDRNGILHAALERCRAQANAVDETAAGRFSRIYSAADEALKATDPFAEKKP